MWAFAFTSSVYLKSVPCIGKSTSRARRLAGVSRIIAFVAGIIRRGGQPCLRGKACLRIYDLLNCPLHVDKRGSIAVHLSQRLDVSSTSTGHGMTEQTKRIQISPQCLALHHGGIHVDPPRMVRLTTDKEVGEMVLRCRTVTA